MDSTHVTTMQFNNTQFQNGVSDTLDSVDKLKNSLSFKGATKGFDDIQSASNKVDFSGMAGGIQTVSNRLSTMGIIGATVIQNLTNSVIGSIRKFGEQTIMQPLRMGFQEYETQMNAVQTILANTKKEGTDLTDVTAALDELNTYADKTIYNFTEMTRNIGTFTAAGVKLDTSVDAIQGIANLAAISGSNSQQASTAMYQLSQALSSGTVKLMDWNSVVNAGMGGQVFQDALTETARVHGIAIDAMIDKRGSFRETLQEGWLSSDILLETLKKFTGKYTRAELEAIGYTDDQIRAIEELGTTATDAATKVKTLTQLKDTLQEAMQSGWTKTFQLVVGDFNEAKSMFTGISDFFGTLIEESATSRNTLVEQWAEKGGRELLLEALWNSLEGINRTINVIKDGFRDIIPPVTADQLLSFTQFISDFSKNFKLTYKHLWQLQRVVKGIASIFDIAGMLGKELGKELFGLLKYLFPLSSGLLENAASAGDFLTNLRNTIKETDFFAKKIQQAKTQLKIMATSVRTFVGRVKEMRVVTEIGKLIDALPLKSFSEFLSDAKTWLSKLSSIRDVLGAIISGLGWLSKKLAPTFNAIGDSISNSISAFTTSISETENEVDFTGLMHVINTGLFGGILLAGKNFINNAGGMFESVGDILEEVRGGLSAWQNTLKAETLKKIATAVGILALSVVALAFVNPDRLKSSLAAITVMFAQLFGANSIISNISANPKQAVSILILFNGLAAALLVLSGAVAILGSMDTDTLKQGLIGITVGLGLMLGAAKLISSFGVSGMIKASTGITILSGALLILSLSVSRFGSMKPESLKQGLLAISAILVGVLTFSKLEAKGGGLISAAAGLTAMSVALLLLSGSVYVLGQMSWDTLTRGLVGIASVMAMLIATSKLMPKGDLFSAATMVVAAGAIIVLAKALEMVSGLTWKELAVGLVGIGAAIAVLAIGLNAMTGALPGAAALLVASIALGVLGGVLIKMADFTWGDLLKGLGVLAIAIIGIAAAASLLTPVLPSILGLAAGMLLIGIAVAGVGAGLFLLASAMVLLAGSSTLVASGFSFMVQAFLDVIPMLVKGLGIALVETLTVIRVAAPAIIATLVTLILELLKAIGVLAPEVADLFWTLLSTGLQALAAHTPDIVQSGYDFILALLTGLERNIPAVSSKATDVAIAFVTAMAVNNVRLVNAGFDAIIAFVDGLAASTEENIPRLMASVDGLGKAVIRGFINGVVSGKGEVFAELFSVGSNAISALKEALGIHSPSRPAHELGEYTTDGLIGGVLSKEGAVRNAMGKLSEILLSVMGDSAERYFEIGSLYAQKWLEGFNSKREDLVEAYTALVEYIFTPLTDSESRYFEHGTNAMRAMSEGILSSRNLVVNSAESLLRSLVAVFVGVHATFLDKGRLIVRGLADGINDNAYLAINAMRNLLSSLDNLSVNYSFSSSMQPVLVGSDISSFSAMSPIDMYDTSKIAQDTSTPSTSVPTPDTGVTQVIYNQYNTSPKALDEVTIYRQTRNHLSRLKEE